MRWAIVAVVAVAVGLGAGCGGGAGSDAHGCGGDAGRLDDGGCPINVRTGCDYMGQHYRFGQSWSPDHGCNGCYCDVQFGVECTGKFCPVDGGPPCERGGGCPEGQACGYICCNAGEQCVNETCMCGSGPACTGWDHCQPVGADAGACGAICCGGDGGPCPQ